jgi:hypothetical protein
VTDLLESPAPAVVRSECLGPRPEFEPIYVGPVFKRDEDGNFILPKLTLGLAAIRWARKWLRGADGEPGWKFTPEQMRILMWWYAVDERGRFIYRDGVIQLIKGAGKDPIAIVIGAIELAGPCRLDYWLTPDGRRVAVWEEGAVPVVCRQKNEPWVQYVGVAFEQNKNSLNYLQGIFTEEAKAEFDITVAITQARAYGTQAKLEAIASSPGTTEGNRPSIVIGNEPHHWLPNTGGDEMKKVVERNVSKMRKTKQSRVLWITNAYDPNQGSTAQQIREAYEDQLARGVEEIFYHSIEAPEDVPLLPDYTRLDADGQRWVDYEVHDGKEVAVPPDRDTVVEYLTWLLDKLRGDAYWLDPEETAKDILKPDADVAESRRFYTNAIVSGEGSYLQGSDVKATIHPELRDARKGIERGDVLRLGWMLVAPEDEVVLFFDGSKSGDSTALVGCRVSDGYTFLVGLWEKPSGDRGRSWRAPREAIDARVHEAFDTFNVVAFWADPSHAKDDADGVRYWDTLIDSWHLKWGERLVVWAQQGGDRVHSILWDMAAPAHGVTFSEAVVRVQDEFDSRNVVWDGHPGLGAHLRNARSFMGKYGQIIRKPGRGSNKKIDAAVCFIGARMLARIVQNKPEKDDSSRRKAGDVWIPPSFRNRRR